MPVVSARDVDNDEEEFSTFFKGDKIIECINAYGIRVCRGDVVQIFPRARGLASFIGRVVEITPASIVLENEDNTIAIRLSEIKMVRKPKDITRTPEKPPSEK
jgi:hypothetical protein